MTTYVDNFTEGSDTALTSHTPDSGGTWTERVNTAPNGALVNAAADVLRISDSASTNSCAVLYTVDWTPAGNDYDVSFTYTGQPPAVARPLWVAARYTATDSYYLGGILRSTAASDMRIVSVTSGPTRTLLAGGDFDPAVGEVFKLEIRDAAKKLYQNGTERLSSADDSITDVGIVGVGAGNIGNNVTDGVGFNGTIDAFTLDDSASAAASGQPTSKRFGGIPGMAFNQGVW